MVIVNSVRGFDSLIFRNDSVAERFLGTGLQNQLRRFDSAHYLNFHYICDMNIDRHFHSTPKELKYNWRLMKTIEHTIRDRVWYKPTYDFDNKKYILSKIKVEDVIYPKDYLPPKVQTKDDSYLVNMLTQDKDLPEVHVRVLFEKHQMYKKRLKVDIY